MVAKLKRRIMRYLGFTVREGTRSKERRGGAGSGGRLKKWNASNSKRDSEIFKIALWSEVLHWSYLLGYHPSTLDLAWCSSFFKVAATFYHILHGYARSWLGGQFSRHNFRSWVLFLGIISNSLSLWTLGFVIQMWSIETCHLVLLDAAGMNVAI